MWKGPWFSLTENFIFCVVLFPIIRVFFISNTFISNALLKLAKNQANAQQQFEAELLLLETLREKRLNTELFLVRILLFSDWIQENTAEK